jgi:hypothetical protein
VIDPFEWPARIRTYACGFTVVESRLTLDWEKVELVEPDVTAEPLQ